MTFEAVNASVFFDYGELLDWFYKPFPAGAVQSNHVFWVESSTPTVMFTKERAEEPTITLNFCNDKFVRRESRIQQLREFSLKPVAAPGMKEIKQVELYSGESLFPQSLPMKFALSHLMKSWKMYRRQEVTRIRRGLLRNRLKHYVEEETWEEEGEAGEEEEEARDRAKRSSHFS